MKKKNTQEIMRVSNKHNGKSPKAHKFIMKPWWCLRLSRTINIGMANNVLKIPNFGTIFSWKRTDNTESKIFFFERDVPPTPHIDETKNISSRPMTTNAHFPLVWPFGPPPFCHRRFFGSHLLSFVNLKALRLVINSPIHKPITWVFSFWVSHSHTCALNAPSK